MGLFGKTDTIDASPTAGGKKASKASASMKPDETKPEFEIVASWCTMLMSWLPPFGLLGCHLCATRRYRHAFIHASTCGFGVVGWAMDLFRLGTYRRWEIPTKPQGRIGAAVSAFMLAWLYGFLFQMTYTYEYEEIAAEYKATPALRDARSWPLFSHAQIGVLCGHALVAAVGAWMANSITPHQTTSFVYTLGGAVAATAICIPTTEGGEIRFPSSVEYDLPRLVSVGAALGALLGSKLRPAQPLAQKPRNRCAAVSFGVLLWWVSMAVLLILHAESTLPDVVLPRVPAACKGTNIRLVKYTEGGAEVWELPEWHLPQYLEVLAVRCKQKKSSAEASGSGVVVEHKVYVGPLLAGNIQKLYGTIEAAWKEIKAHVKMVGGWRAFLSELYEHFRNKEASDYAALGLSEGASLAEIKSAYRGLARKLHPDKLKDVSPEEKELATAKFRKVSEAYERLSATKIKESSSGGGETTSFASDTGSRGEGGSEQRATRPSRRRRSE